MIRSENICNHKTLLTVVAERLSQSLAEPGVRITLELIKSCSPRHVYLVGGAPRNTLASLIYRSDYSIADFDIVIDTDDTSVLSQLSEHFGAVPTPLGGIRIPASDRRPQQDIW